MSNYNDYGWRGGHMEHDEDYDDDQEWTQRYMGGRGYEDEYDYNQRNREYERRYTGDFNRGRGMEWDYDRGEQNRADEWMQDGPHRGRGPKGYQRSSERIREDVCERLAHHGLVDATHIEVTVEDGEVTLEGTVTDRRQKRMAEDAIYSINGVRDIHNRLRVQSQGSMMDNQDTMNSRRNSGGGQRENNP